jgi:hypothetical protein
MIVSAHYICTIRADAGTYKSARSLSSACPIEPGQALGEPSSMSLPFSPPYGPAIGFLNGLHPESKFLAVKKQLPNTQP